MSDLTTEQLKIELERAATSLMTDDEICLSLSISTTTLKKHYNIVEQSRLKLKQRLNAKRLSDVAQGSGDVGKLIQSIPVNNKNKQKGKTNNPNGRPKGTTNKISGATILESVEKYSGERFEDLLAQGYVESIQQRDKATRLQYEKMFLNKVVSDKAEMDITTGGEKIQAIYSFIPTELADWKKDE